MIREYLKAYYLLSTIFIRVARKAKRPSIGEKIDVKMAAKTILSKLS